MKVLIFIVGLFMAVGCSNNHRKILKHISEDGLTSVVFTEGKDTFALDYLTPVELDSLINSPY